MLNHLSFLWDHYLDVIYKTAYYRAFQASICDENAVICIYLLKSKLLEEKGQESFVLELWRLFEAMKSL